MAEQKSISRRRALTILAGGGFALLGGSSRRETLYEWRGMALGADARIVLAHADRQFADRTLGDVWREIERLENIFSLFRPRSALSKLNRTGVLRSAPLELIHLTRRAQALAAITDGAFDITVQPLWELYAAHFRTYPNDTSGPPMHLIDAVRKKIGTHLVRIEGSDIRLSPGTRLTFNGIAQGYITDRITALLKSRGWNNVLIDAGEIRGLGMHPDGRPWRIALANGIETLLADCAMSTSDGAGTRFTALAPQHHLFDPRSGLCAPADTAMSITARYATDADALSTALFVAPPEMHRRILARVPGARIVTARKV